MEKIIIGYAWPIVALIFSITFIYLFKEPLSKLIGRITEIDSKGLKTGSSPESQLEKTETTDEIVQQLLNEVGDSIVINEIVEKKKKFLEEKGLSTDGATVNVLVKHLSGTQLLLAFEQIHNLIFGSQIVLLKKLNEVTGQGMKVELVNKYIEKEIKLYPVELKDWTVDQYLTFLRSHLLITNEGGQIHITNLGVEIPYLDGKKWS